MHRFPHRPALRLQLLNIIATATRNPYAADDLHLISRPISCNPSFLVPTFFLIIPLFTWFTFYFIRPIPPAAKHYSAPDNYYPQQHHNLPVDI